jgi:hypothetical protein
MMRIPESCCIASHPQVERHEIYNSSVYMATNDWRDINNYCGLAWLKPLCPRVILDDPLVSSAVHPVSLVPALDTVFVGPLLQAHTQGLPFRAISKKGSKGLLLLDCVQQCLPWENLGAALDPYQLCSE